MSISELMFDAEHEAVYGIEKFETEEGCFKLARKYHQARRLCSKCFNFQISSDKLCENLKELELKDFDDHSNKRNCYESIKQ